MATKFAQCTGKCIVHKECKFDAFLISRKNVLGKMLCEKKKMSALTVINMIPQQSIMFRNLAGKGLRFKARW